MTSSSSVHGSLHGSPSGGFSVFGDSLQSSGDDSQALVASEAFSTEESRWLDATEDIASNLGFSELAHFGSLLDSQAMVIAEGFAAEHLVEQEPPAVSQLRRSQASLRAERHNRRRAKEKAARLEKVIVVASMFKRSEGKTHTHTHTLTSL